MPLDAPARRARGRHRLWRATIAAAGAALAVCAVAPAIGGVTRRSPPARDVVVAVTDGRAMRPDGLAGVRDGVPRARQRAASAPRGPLPDPVAALEDPRPERRTAAATGPPPEAVTVVGALRRARSHDAIGARTYRRYRRTVRHARAALTFLAGARRAEMAAALAVVDGLAVRRLLTVERMPAAFLTLRRNLEVRIRRPFPAPGDRFRFGRDAAVFQYFPGRGIAFHPLGSFGRVNGLARVCVERRVERRRGGERCRPRAVHRGLDRLVALAARRRGFTAWEYLVAFGGGTPPWISGMAQATAIQALSRGAKALGERRWRRVAASALGAFEQPPPTGVRVAQPRGVYYAMYSFSPGLRILNGSLQAILGLHDMAELSGSARARRLFDAAEPLVRRSVPAYDTGSWSLYARGGRAAPVGYHRLMTKQLGALCDRLGYATYCDAHARFARHLHPPSPPTLVHPRPQLALVHPRPQLGLAWRARAHPGQASPIVLSLSERSTVRVRISLLGNGRTVLSRRLRVGPGRTVLAWTPTRPARHRLRVEAVGAAGSRTVRRATLRVTARRGGNRASGEERGRGGERRDAPERRRRDRSSDGRRRGAAEGAKPPATADPPATEPSPVLTPDAAPDAAPTPEETPTPTATPTPEPTPDDTPTPEATPDDTPTPEYAPTPTATPTPEASRSPEARSDPDATPTPDPTPDADSQSDAKSEPGATPTGEPPDAECGPTPRGHPTPDASTAGDCDGRALDVIAAAPAGSRLTSDTSSLRSGGASVVATRASACDDGCSLRSTR